eukprot:CAMPEP_0181176272 /NCGR_PEP_ID=MMETSP1096-20121128/4539_1 /TAXON_ID=156174 ORGANISM="Chrysochromulina ericina, Strain CCMP281" /NCGR_SAMPLE_ID=MMETSP1096 /ASSEMBLY_ACC=CAM_ASM_000453 /LENGTH=157 /DNA_ID=CAMNT_0023264345 /DNA_START=1 /DNA_END=474 /DNA_ORIENTATION=+
MRAAGSKLIEVQLAIHQQLYSVADQIAQVQAANPSALHSQPEVIDRDKEVEELSRALRRQQQLVHDAHRQLLELSTKRKPLGVASAHAEVGALRAALGEQEVGRMVAEARADELQAQVRLLEEQGLRLRLHPPQGQADSTPRKPARVLLPSSIAFGS